MLNEFLDTSRPKLLDVGCGAGFFLDRATRSFDAKGFGVDVSHQSMVRGFSTSAAPFCPARSDARLLPFERETFDVVVCLDVLEHIEGPELALMEMIRVLRPGGPLVCYAVGNKNRYTLNWLISKAMEMLGHDHWSRAGHLPELLVDPDKVRHSLDLDVIDRLKILPFHSFATIAYDQALLLAFWLATKLRLIGDEPKVVADRSRRLLQRLTRITELIRPALIEFDKTLELARIVEWISNYR